MKPISKHIDKHGSVSSRLRCRHGFLMLRKGYVTLRPEDDEDMWHLYNLIQTGDSVRATTVRYDVDRPLHLSTDSYYET